MDGRSALAGKILDLPHSQSGRAIMLVQTAAKEGSERWDSTMTEKCRVSKKRYFRFKFAGRWTTSVVTYDALYLSRCPITVELVYLGA